MSTKTSRTAVIGVVTLLVVLLVVGQGLAQTVATPEALGDELYFDINLSNPAGQSCASCHDPAFGFVDPDKGLPVSEGVIPGLFGGRNSPSSAYAMYAPFFDENEWIGGQFWDGRATGYGLGDPLADQAVGPFLNPVEMANTKEGVLTSIAASDYYWTLFVPVCGEVDLSTQEAIDATYNCVGESIATFERTGLFAQFSSKYDFYLQACLTAGGGRDDCAKGIGVIAEQVGTKIFSKKEWSGMQLFMNEVNDNNGILEPGEGAMCVACHIAEWTTAADYELPVVVPAWSGGWIPPMFTDFTYDNLGVPKSDHKLLVDNPVDLGLGGPDHLNDPEADGLFKVMTLRNIHLTAPYAHNGYFKDLLGITHFYNTRDALESCDLVNKPKPGKNCWPAPEVPGTINDTELGDLGLSDVDEEALEKFMKTLSDGYQP